MYRVKEISSLKNLAYYMIFLFPDFTGLGYMIHKYEFGIEIENMVKEISLRCDLFFLLFIILIKIIISKLIYDIYCEATTGTHILEFDFKKLKNYCLD